MSKRKRSDEYKPSESDTEKIARLENELQQKDIQLNQKNNQLNQKNNQLKQNEKLISVSADSRIKFWGTKMPGSESNSRSSGNKVTNNASVPKAELDKTHIKNILTQQCKSWCCLFCGDENNVTLAHIASSNSNDDNNLFNKPAYNYTNLNTQNNRKNNNNIKIQNNWNNNINNNNNTQNNNNKNTQNNRNFLPLCGNAGIHNTCHNEFDKHGMTLLYNPFSKKYRIHCFDNKFSKYHKLHNKNITMKHKPYIRLLALKTRICLKQNMDKTNPEDLVNLIILSNLSENCNN